MDVQMSKSLFEALVAALGVLFTVAFFIVVVPPLIQSGDVLGAFAAGFVNPYSSGYSIDAIVCAFILMIWVLHERKTLNLKHGWMAILLSFVPGVATAFAFYLVIRSRQLSTS